MKVKTITVSAKDAVAYMENTNALFKALWELTDMIKEESELKKHHRAYLHIRENIDEKVKEARVLMNKVSMDTLKSSINHNASDDAPNCKDCVCCDCDDDCSDCAFSPCYEEEEADCDEDYPFEDADDDTVVISKNKLGEMLDDMFTMAEIISHLTHVRSEEDGKRMQLYRDAKQEADEIMDRWEDEYEPDEYYSD